MFQIGPSLREARERRGLSPAEVQKAIRIRDRYLHALEEERWEQLPGDAYVKGFLRTYADFLGLDGNLYVEEYNSRFAQRDDQLLVPQALARRSTAAGIAFLRPLLALGLIAGVVAAIAAWQLHGSGTPQRVGDTTTHHHRQTTGTTTSTQHRHKHKTSGGAVLPTHVVLTAARGDCWLWVRSGGATGPTVYEATLVQGKTLSVSLKNGPIWLDVGDPPNLDVRLGGRLLTGLPTQAGNILLTRRGLQAG